MTRLLLPCIALAAAAAAQSQPLLRDTVRSERRVIPDVAVTDEDGRALHFYSDLVKNRTVAINFLFTTCTTICPPLSATFARMQTLAPGAAGRDYQLISVTVDPVTDTAARRKAWMKRFGARPGWTFVGGSPEEINTLLKALEAFAPVKEEHTPLVLIGNDVTGRWTRTSGLNSAARILPVIRSFAAGGQGSAPAQSK